MSLVSAAKSHLLFSKLSRTEIQSVLLFVFLQFGDSGRAGLKDEEELVDILEERRRSTDLSFALRTFNPHPYRDAVSCSTAELNRAVLESQYLRYVAKEVR